MARSSPLPPSLPPPPPPTTATTAAPNRSVTKKRTDVFTLAVACAPTELLGSIACAPNQYMIRGYPAGKSVSGDVPADAPHHMSIDRNDPVRQSHRPGQLYTYFTLCSTLNYRVNKQNCGAKKCTPVYVCLCLIMRGALVLGVARPPPPASLPPCRRYARSSSTQRLVRRPARARTIGRAL